MQRAVDADAFFCFLGLEDATHTGLRVTGGLNLDWLMHRDPCRLGQDLKAEDATVLSRAYRASRFAYLVSETRLDRIGQGTNAQCLAYRGAVQDSGRQNIPHKQPSSCSGQCSLGRQLRRWDKKVIACWLLPKDAKERCHDEDKQEDQLTAAKTGYRRVNGSGSSSRAALCRMMAQSGRPGRHGLLRCM